MTRIIFVGGFLGAGKTTLIAKVAKLLKDQGKQVGIITNDQAPDLVDTKLLGSGSMNIAEVTGSCFCCDFKALRRAMEKLAKNQQADIIIAEPVGSCTDLSATLINPIRDIMKTEVTVAPLTVLADPARLKAVLSENSGLHPSAKYIIRKQLEESDIIAITKTDLYPEEEISRVYNDVKALYPERDVITLSSKTGNGVSQWLEKALSANEAGQHIIELDYRRYAEGEAILGWLNCSASLEGESIDFDAFTRALMQDFSERLDSKNLNVGHVKMMVERGDRYIASNLTGKNDTLSFRWSAGEGENAEMIVNARVEMSPVGLEILFRETLQAHTEGKISVHIKNLSCISPGYPKPTFRYK